MNPAGKIAAMILMIPGVLFLWPASEALLKGQFIDGGIFGAFGVVIIGIAAFTFSRIRTALVVAAVFAVPLALVMLAIGTSGHTSGAGKAIAVVLALAEAFAAILFIYSAANPEG